MNGSARAFAAVGCLAGLFGVGLSAAAAHLAGSGSLEIAARFLLVHAPALMALAALLASGLAGARLGVAAGLALTAGLVLFCGDLAVRALAGIALLPFAAPAGGVALMGGWALAGLAVLGRARRPG